MNAYHVKNYRVDVNAQMHVLYSECFVKQYRILTHSINFLNFNLSATCKIRCQIRPWITNGLRIGLLVKIEHLEFKISSKNQRFATKNVGSRQLWFLFTNWIAYDFTTKVE